ncbi:hypothetical protein X777_16104 [Ooceraea biroi]|uniref:Uncharacterized protein n=1 Tax=Ooceraea biroi TaxID=2015173 RepID=A0A026WW22_OOCBI|nr:hypothetical protein X777_16104 [Ooceraea biroi]
MHFSSPSLFSNFNPVLRSSMQIGSNWVRDRRWKAAKTNQFANGSDLSESLGASRAATVREATAIPPLKKTRRFSSESTRWTTRREGEKWREKQGSAWAQDR